MIEVKHLSKTFGSRFTRKNCVLNDVSFNLPDKGLVAIFGKSGSGKTTLLNIIGGLDLQDKGEVIIEGERITNKNRDNIRNKKLVLFSKTIILSMAIQLVKLCIIL